MEQGKEPTKLQRLAEGDSIEFHDGCEIFLTCCDCGLVHILKGSCTPDGKFRLQFFRDNKQTNIIRAKMFEEDQEDQKGKTDVIHESTGASVTEKG